jgi:hypothetical protein
MSQTWTISADGRVFGPYSAEQMQNFRDQGRLAAHSLIARAGETQFRPACEDSELAPLFSAPQEAPQNQVRPPARFGQEPMTGEPNRYVIIADMKSASIAGLEDEIFKLGPACRVMAQAWVVASEISINAMRTGLMQKLGKLDNLLIVDTTHDKAAWFNFGIDTEAKLRSLWARGDQRKAS